MARLFGTDGVRGLANGETLTASLALDLAVSAAQVLADAGQFEGHRPRAVIGRDPRVSGQFLQAAVAAGLASDGRVRATVLSGLRQGYEMRLVRGAHAAYDGGGRGADEITARVELELEAAGAKLVAPHGRLF